jgi:hypothetical protein
MQMLGTYFEKQREREREREGWWVALVVLITPYN